MAGFRKGPTGGPGRSTAANPTRNVFHRQTKRRETDGWMRSRRWTWTPTTHEEQITHIHIRANQEKHTHTLMADRASALWLSRSGRAVAGKMWGSSSLPCSVRDTRWMNSSARLMWNNKHLGSSRSTNRGALLIIKMRRVHEYNPVSWFHREVASLAPPLPLSWRIYFLMGAADTCFIHSFVYFLAEHTHLRGQRTAAASSHTLSAVIQVWMGNRYKRCSSGEPRAVGVQDMSQIIIPLCVTSDPELQPYYFFIRRSTSEMDGGPQSAAAPRSEFQVRSNYKRHQGAFVCCLFPRTRYLASAWKRTKGNETLMQILTQRGRVKILAPLTFRESFASTCQRGGGGH